mgnify:CR=1 FL=1
MKGFSDKEPKKKKASGVETFSVPLTLRENNDIKTNTASKISKKQIINQAFQLHAKGNISEAVKYYQLFINEGFQDAMIFSNYGVILKDNEKLKEAELYTRKAIEIKPDFAQYHANLGDIYRSLGKLVEAELSNREAIKLKPDLAQAHQNLGSVLMYMGKFNEAEISLRKAIKLKLDYAIAYRNLSICLYNRGDNLSALEYILKATSPDPKEEINNRLLTLILENKIKKSDNKNYNRTEEKIILSKEILDQNPLILNRKVETDLIDSLYKIRSIDQSTYMRPTYGNARGSDYYLFELDEPMIQMIKKDLISIASKSVKSDIFIIDSFYTISKSGAGLVSHNHLNDLDILCGEKLSDKKFSLVYYLSIGDQDCEEPGILKLENPSIEILPNNGLIIIFPSKRKHSVFYKGTKDRIIIGINFYSI